MPRFFFTYGNAPSYPFQGGWTEVVAPDRFAALAAFRAIHENIAERITNCCSVYTEGQFEDYGFEKSGNLGAYCHEVITLSVVRK